MSYSDMKWCELKIQGLQGRNDKQYEMLEEKDQEIQKLREALNILIGSLENSNRPADWEALKHVKAIINGGGE